MEAKKSQPKNKSGKAFMALNHIQKLYGIESMLKGKCAEEKQFQELTGRIMTSFTEGEQ